MEQKQDRFVKQQKMMALMVIICFVMVIAVMALGWYVFDYSKNKIQKNNETVATLLKNINVENSGEILDVAPKEISKKQIDFANLSAEEVVKLASRHILLTEGELTVANITNIEGLRIDYPELFTYAKNGDKLIFYSLGIIIYDPIFDKVVDVMRRLPDSTVIPRSVNETK